MKARDKKASPQPVSDKAAARTGEEVALLFSFFNEIGIISQLSSNEFERHLPEKLTIAQFSVLNWFVRVDKEATPGRLARAFQVTPGAMTNTIKKLQARGLVKIEPDSGNGRQKRITLTPAGKQLRDRAIKLTAPVLMGFAEAFPPAQLVKHLKYLQRVRQYLDEERFKSAQAKR